MFLLRHTNNYGERHYFQRLGAHWPYKPECRLIERTTPDIRKAVRFDTLPECIAVWITANRPPDWRALEVEGDEMVREIDL